MKFSYTTAANLRVRREFYDKYSTRSIDWDKWILSHLLNAAEPLRILDLGGGYGQVWRSVGSLPLQINLTDSSPDMLAAAKELPKNVSKTVMPAEKLEFPDGSFEVVTALNMLYHVADRTAVYREVVRVLKPNGVFIFTTTGRQHLSELRSLIQLHSPSAAEHLIATDFQLEDIDELNPFFDSYEVHTFNDGLKIDNATSVMGYIDSTPAGAHLSQVARASVERQVEAAITQAGTFDITPVSGLAVCRGPRKETRIRLTKDACPFCHERPLRNEYWILIAELDVSRLCLTLNQTYPGQSLLIFDGGQHAENLDDLEENDYCKYMNDLRHAVAALRKVFKPDHVNVELLGNIVPHLHFHITPRYKSDPRWTMPIWTTNLVEMHNTIKSDSEYESLVSRVRHVLSGKDSI